MMKKSFRLLLLFAVLVSGIAFAQQNPEQNPGQDLMQNSGQETPKNAEQKPEMEFKRTEHNFGIVKEEMGTVSTQFEFSNTGKSPLIIQRVSSSCGCTTPEYTRKPILPGKKGTISATYHTVRRPGTFNKTIRVYTNVPDTVYVLTIKGNVTPKQ